MPCNSVKFANHFRSEVAFGEFRGAIRFCHMSLYHAEIEPLLGKPARDGAYALNLVAITSEPRLVRDALEFRQIVGEPTFLIGLPEKLCVGKPRPQYSFMPGAHQPLGILGQD